MPDNPSMPATPTPEDWARAHAFVRPVVALDVLTSVEAVARALAELRHVADVFAGAILEAQVWHVRAEAAEARVRELERLGHQKRHVAMGPADD